MLETPQCSVVIPAFNCAAYVAQAIDSVLNQTIGRQSIEIIVLDDGSTDATAQRVRAFGSAVRFVQLEHGGVSKARNAGIELARASVVAFLDADDYWLPQRLERAMPRLEAEERIFVNTEFFVETDGERAPDSYYRSRALRCLFELSAAAQLTFALEENFISSMVVAPAHALRAAGGFNPQLHYGEDWDLWLRLLQAGYAARLITEPCAVYRLRRPGATSARHDAAMARDRVFVLSQYRDAVSKYRWNTAVRLAKRLALRQLIARFVPLHT
ncbi:MAG TPA: glycosyltransferase family 2 protein [Candidatus Baltobacteraceae bacterium]|nr:glycosyltransferase family 2 protein [Candidatus Baltobacteraceae bacterium]